MRVLVVDGPVGVDAVRGWGAKRDEATAGVLAAPAAMASLDNHLPAFRRCS
jgi:hypothetical protein